MAKQKQTPAADWKEKALTEVGDVLTLIRHLAVSEDEDDSLDQQQRMLAIQTLAAKGSKLYMKLTDQAYQPGGTDHEDG